MLTFLFGVILVILLAAIVIPLLYFVWMLLAWIISSIVELLQRNR